MIPGLGWEDPLEKGMATHPSIVENPVDTGVWRAIVHGVAKESDMTLQLKCHIVDL